MAVGVCFEGLNASGVPEKFCTRRYESVEDAVGKLEQLGYRGVIRRRGVVLAVVGGGHGPSF